MIGWRRKDGEGKQKNESGSAEASPQQKLIDWIKSIAVALVIWFFLQHTLIKAFKIPSGSMEQTILIGDFLFVNKAIYGISIPFTPWRLPSFREPRQNDIVVFESVETPGLDVVKRIMGAPGDTLAMRHDSIFRNGVFLDEPYVQHADPAVGMDAVQRRYTRSLHVPYLVNGDTATYLPDLRNWGPIAIPAGHYFLMGDSRDASHDSRMWGFLPRENISGKPMFVYYSYDKASWRPIPILTAIRWTRFFRRPR